MPANSTKKDRLPPWGQDEGGESAGFGRWLKQQRELREVPLREIADVTKISLRYLEALEQDRFDVLPAPVFAKGFLREYSRYVGLDPDEVVNSFLIATGELVQGDEDEDTVEKRQARSSRDRTRLLATLAVIVIVIVIATVALVSGTRFQRQARPSPIAPPIQAPRAAAESAQEAAPEIAAAPLTVTLDFTEDCWMEAVVDDDRSLSELRVQGEAMRLEAQEKVVLTLGNPSGVRVEVNGVPYSLPVAQNRIVRNLEIDLALAEDLAAGESR